MLGNGGVASLIQDRDMIPPGSRVLCAVSGGADSVCLLHILSRREDISVVAAHYNHQLRWKESDRDEQFVRELCEKWGIPLVVGRGDVKAFARKEKRSTEEAGRILRYSFLFQAAETEGCDLIATAHNADDNAETMLLSLIRGTGLTGLTGIPFRRENIVRPLLGATRRDILYYLALHLIPHREDSSNRDRKYARNRLRADVMPVLWHLNPRVSEHMANTAVQLAEIDRYLDENARVFLLRAQESPGRIALPMDVLFQAPKVLRPRIIFQLLDRLEVGRKDLRSVHLEAVLSLSPGGSLDLPHGVTVRREYDLLILTTQEDSAPPWAAFVPREGENPVPGTGWTVVLEGPPWPGLVVRPRQTGDALTLPNGHRRSLKRLFIDKKIPRLERDAIPVVADGEGILAVAGFGPNLSHPRFQRVQIIPKKKEENGK